MSIRRFTQRLSFRQAVISVLAAAVVGLTFTLANLAIELDRERDRIAALVAETEHTMLAPAAQAAFMLDPALSDGIAAGLLNNGIFVSARLVDDSGNVLAEAGKVSDLDVGFLGRLMLRELHGIEAALAVDRLNPSSGEAEKMLVGMLTADLDERTILARLWGRARTMMLFGAGQTLMLGVILAIVYQIVLSRPILDVAGDLRQVDPRAPAATLVRVPRGHADTEVGFLVGKTNALLRQFAATLRKSERIQQELSNERAQLDGIMQSVIDGIVTTDAAFRVERINRAATALFGYGDEEIQGSPISKLFDGADWPSIEAALTQAGTDSSAVGGVHREVVARDKAGRTVDVSIGISRMRFGPKGSFVCVIRDITARKLVEHRLAEALREAENANRAKSQFLATMSHELRTPLNAIIGFSDMIRDELLGPVGLPTYREYARDIGESGSHLLSIINDILDISKIEAGQATIDPEPLDARRTIAGCIGLMQHQADAAGVVLAAEVAEDCPALYADARSLKQIVINLVSNAVKFTATGGSVRITALAVEGGGVRVAVADTGIGIAEHDLARIWRPFEQVENALSRRKGGTGLGLPLVKRLAELHGARVFVTSKLGEGTSIGVDFRPAVVVRDPARPSHQDLDALSGPERAASRGAA